MGRACQCPPPFIPQQNGTCGVCARPRVHYSLRERFLRWWYKIPPEVSERTFTLHGPPVTREMQQLFGAYGRGAVKGIVQLEQGLVVEYDNGTALTFVPYFSGGKVSKPSVSSPA